MANLRTVNPDFTQEDNLFSLFRLHNSEQDQKKVQLPSEILIQNCQRGFL